MSQVGLVTFHSPLNYGARFQAFALQEAVKKCGAHCSIINYVPQSNIISHSLSLPRRCYRLVTQLRFGKRIRRLAEGFSAWTTANLSLTEQLLTEVQLRQEAEKYDTFICGSDQVWRDPQRGFYYLDFVPAKTRRIAYAPSFGNLNFSSEAKEQIKRYLERFSSISVRETDGAEFLSELLGKQIPAVLDPTLVWDANFWRSAAVPAKYRLPKRFALIFTVQDTIPCFEAAKQVCSRLGLEPVLIDTAQRLVWHPFLKDYFDLSPAEFLYLLDLSSFVVTTSFHGTAFALNYAKPFLTICRGNKENVNSRIVSLADIVGVRDRILFPGDKIPESIYSEIDPQVGQCLDTERKRSLRFLAESISKSAV